MKQRGLWFGIAAYTLWGVFPIYFKHLASVPSIQIIFHRVIWSFITCMILIFIKRDSKEFFRVIRSKKNIAIYLFAGYLLATNWLIYVWAINHDFVVEASLGYFINPLFSVALGTIFLKEKLRAWQWVCIGLAAAAVGYMTFQYGNPPWIALGLALTFGIYGLIKKTAPLGSLHSLTLETATVFLPALIFLIYVESQGSGAFGHASMPVNIMLGFTGIVTALPLLLFASAARQIPLSLVGILQYIAPTGQFLLGVFLYHEPFTHVRLVGFSIIWIALIAFTIEGFWNKHRRVVVVEIA